MICVFYCQWVKGKRKETEWSRADWCMLCAVLLRGGCCCAVALPWAPAGSVCHEAAESSKTQRGSPATEGQRALQRAFQAVPGSEYSTLFWPSRSCLRPRGVAGEGPRHKSSRVPWCCISATHWNWVPWGVGQEAIAVLSSWTPLR